MNFLADESVDGSIVNRLRSDGYAVEYVAEMQRGIDDDHVLNMANSSNALLLTEDKDFGELVYRQRRVHRGVILIRLLGLSSTAKADRVAEALRDEPDAFDGAFTVISPGIMRIRRP